MHIPFDILYEGFCNRIRSLGKAESILQLVKKEISDSSRIKALLTEEPDLYALLERNISDSFEKKDEVVARKLQERGSEGRSAELLTEAIAYCVAPASFEEKVVPVITDQNKLKTALQSFMESPMSEITSEVKIMAEIFYERGSVLFSNKRYLPAYRDFLAAWLLEFPKTLEITFRVAICCFECGDLDISKELLQCTAQHLRTLPMSNEEKSAWTMNIVKVLKGIEGCRKVNQCKGQTNSEISQLGLGQSSIQMYGQSLFSGESKDISGTSESIQLKFSAEKGRHMVVTQNIPPGSTVIAEMPYAWSISKANYHKFCLWCLQRIHSGIPCSTCASAVFCDATCRKNAQNAFHGQECKILKLLDSSQKLGNMAHLCFRTILSTPLSTVLEYSMQLVQKQLPEQVILGHDGTGKLESSSYAAVFAQTPNSEQRQAGDLLKRTFSAIYLTLCFKHVGYFGEPHSDNLKECKLKLSETELNVAGVMLRHLQGASCNAYGINYIEKKCDRMGTTDDRRSLEINEMGGATYPIISTTNHSCHPNAYRINMPGKMCVVKTLREIKQGEEIFDCYGPLYLTEPRQDRIAKLQSQYLFRCNCLPCSEDWPMYGKLREQAIRYKCVSCQCELKVNGKNINNKIKCPYCDTVTEMKKLLGTLKDLKERFCLIKSSILAETFQPFCKDIEALLCDYICMCQRAYLDPCIHTVEAQEVLKLFWNISIRNS